MNFLKFQKRNPTTEEWLYHVTYFNRLSSIAAHGLRPNSPSAVGAGSYDFHKKNRLFLTEEDGVFFWYGRAEAFAEDKSEDLLEDEMVPVVLRMTADSLPEEEELDEIGTRDALANAWIVTKKIPPRNFEVWNGKEWVDLVDDYNTIDIASALKDMADDQDHEDGFEHIWVFKDDSPLIPPELKP